jgi:nucleoside-diphosphate-sugar epimerase
LRTDESVGVLGATSQLGRCLLELLNQSEIKVTAFSRRPATNVDEHIQWRELSLVAPPEALNEISCWVCAAPIWVLPDYFELLETSGAKRVVALSSTSRFTKGDSTDPAEQAVAQQLMNSEAHLQDWAETKGVEWVILRPTMIYGQGKDKNITEIARFISRWGFFPILGKGDGLRQPVHVEDVAKACLAAITAPAARNRAFDISGAEMLSFKEMTHRIFLVLDKQPRFLLLPRWCFRAALLGLRLIPRFRYWSIAMAERMDRDMVFDHSNAKSALGFAPRPFSLSARDLPD